MEPCVSPFLLAFALFFGLFSVNCNALGQCLQAESSALLQLKRGFTSSLLSTWLPGTDCCTWVGVTCDESRRVIGLELGDHSITGKIDPSLFNLTSLRNLSFTFNQFGGISIPDSGWDRLVNLSKLDLSEAEFVGEVPAAITRLSKLISLDLSNNDGLYLTLNPTFLQNMSSLRELYLGGVNLSAYGDKWLDALVNFTPMLEKLSMYDCSLSGFFPEQIFQGRSLKYLDMSQNSLLSGSLPDFSKESSLETLLLSNTNFSGNIPDTIGNLYFLIDLGLSSCQFSGIIPPSMWNLTQLWTLDLSNNNFSGAVDLKFLQNFTSLDYLDLSNTGFSLSSWDADNGSSSSPYPSLSKLILAGCNLTKIPAFIASRQPYHLDLSNNRIFGEIPSWCWSIQELNLSLNFFTHFAKPFSNFSISQDTYIIDLHSNMLEGPIPPLPSNDIVLLDFSNNRFTNSISSNIPSYLNTTELISLANNRMIGEIPPSICNFTKLKILDLSNNVLTGSIPPCLLEKGNSLNVLNLRGNQLHGVIPHRISPTCNLQTINLRDNQLEGLLPMSLSSCKSLEILDVGNNKLEDTFPYWLGSMPSLKVLILRSNKFYGLVESPDGYYEAKNVFSMLHVFDISSNNFSGKLSEGYFKNFKSMMVNGANTTNNFAYSLIAGDYYYANVLTIMNKGQLMTLQNIWMIIKSIDTSNNYFDGEIPVAIGKLISLHVLNMSQNHLTGKIPPEIGSLSQLESLDLSMNSLSGTIPQELVSLYFLSELNLSYNKLVGKIPKGGQFSTFLNTSFEGNEGLCCWKVNNTVAPPSNLGGTSQKNRSYMIVLGLLFGIGFGVSMAIVVVLDILYCQRGKRRRSQRTSS